MGAYYKNWVGAVRRFRLRRSSAPLQKTKSMELRCNWVGAVRRRFSTKSSPQETIIVYHNNNSETCTIEDDEEDKEEAKEKQILDPAKEIAILDPEEVAVIVFHDANSSSETFTDEEEEEDKEKANEEQILDSKEDGADAAGDGSSSSSEELLLNQDTAAIKIQAFFRGHLARRLYQALRSLVRLQAVVRGFNICVKCNE